MNPTEPEEERLRAALRAVVPEAPTVDPPPAARARGRGPVVAVLAVAAAVVAIAVVPQVLDGPPDDRPTEEIAGPSPTPTPTPTPTRDVDPTRGRCPPTLPPVSRAETDLPALDEVRTVRLCADPSSGLGAPLDALVGQGVRTMADSVADLGDADRGRCAAFSYLAVDTSLAFTLDDGSLRLVPTDVCTDLDPAASSPGRVAAGEVTAAFLAALDEQRQVSRYPLLSVDAKPLTCDAATTQAPVRPTDEVLGTVVVCPGPDAEPVPVGDAGLRALEDALRRAPEPTSTTGVGGYDDELPYLLYRTTRLDVVRLSPTSAGLLLDPWQVGFGLGRSTVVPLDMSDVTDP